MARNKLLIPRSRKPLGVGLCSVCDEATLTFGNQSLGGIRWCRDCIKLSLAWVQMTREQRDGLMRLMDAAEQTPAVKRQLEETSNLTPEMRKAISIGEAKRRLWDANMQEGAV